MMELSKINAFFRNQSLIDIFVCNLLNTIMNKLDGEIIVRARFFAKDTFEDSSVLGIFT